MKFMAGYQMRPSSDFLEELLRQKDRLYEVYFSWGSFASGRGTMFQSGDLTEWEAQARQAEDLQALSSAGIALNLLFNGNCYGKDSQSRAFFHRVGQTVDSLGSRFGLQSVTTASPLIAKFLKNNFPELKVRASVNMGIGTCQGMDYLADYFDEFYLQREQNRNWAAIRDLRQWCGENGKTLFALANSGCLNYCSAHTFHDNLVAHEAEIAAMDNAYDFPGICREYAARPEKRVSLIRDASFIRPEDLSLYEGLFPAVKLATRVHSDPARVLRAYCAGKSSGSVLGLLEPDHTGLLYPELLENSRFPKNFGETVLHCGKNCAECGYCARVYDSVRIRLPGEEAVGMEPLDDLKG
ncbi:MAG: hypothetical protein ACOX64_10325 [Candidatus Merdivicinus sp.]|jgi:hypothetical protein